MSHPQQKFFIQNTLHNLNHYSENKKVLEVGSLNINGTDRVFFKNCEYIGIDIAQGKDVDLVYRGENFCDNANTFDCVISSEMFEHNKEYDKCFLNMIRLLKRDGLIVFTCASAGRRQHGTNLYQPEFSPNTVTEGGDYYKNLISSDFSSLINFQSFFSVYSFFEDRTSADLYFFGLGKNASSNNQNIAIKLIENFNDFYYKRNILGEY
jgi:SAM-dependent methyltransferase